MLDHVSDENFLLYAAQYYDNPTCATQFEFLDDLSRIKMIKKMLKRYAKDGTINERLVLNHIILLYNVFQRDAATRMLVWTLRDLLQYLKPFLVFLNYWPETIRGVGFSASFINGSDVSMDLKLVELLRKI